MSEIPSNDLARCVIRNILMMEREEREYCLGREFYDALIEDLVDYDSAVAWAPGSYSADDVVIYKGVYYKALELTSSEPSSRQFWTMAPKFTTDAHNSLWDAALGKYLALSAIRDSIPPTSTQFRSTGVIKIVGSRERPADIQEAYALQDHVFSMVYRAYRALVVYINEFSTAGALGSFKGLTSTCSCGDSITEITSLEALFYGQVITEDTISCDKCRLHKGRNIGGYGVF